MGFKIEGGGYGHGKIRTYGIWQYITTQRLLFKPLRHMSLMHSKRIVTYK